MGVKREKIHFASVEELLVAPVDKEGTVEIRIDQIYPFENHPFKVLDDEKMDELVESIKANGVLSPVLVRPDDEGSYEMISGHRRMHAAKLAGLTLIPAIIKEMTDDEATICMVDANVQREEILPSERAFSFKMKMEAMNRQGKRLDLAETSGTEFHKLDVDDRKTRTTIGNEAGMTGRQVSKYIRLTDLVPDLLDLVDMKKVTITLAVEISYLDKQIQEWIYEYIKDNSFIKPEQISAVRNLDNPERLTQSELIRVMNDALPKKKQPGGVTISQKKLDKYFSPHVSAMEREHIIIQLLEHWKESQVE